MKISKVADHNSLKKPIDPNDFAAREKYIDKDSLIVKFAERFPAKKILRTEPSNLRENPQIVAHHKSLADLTFLDWELIRYAYHQAIEHKIEKHEKERRGLLKRQSSDANTHAIVTDLEKQRFRIFMGWLERFHMEGVFKKLHLSSLDDFKKLMHFFHSHADDRQRVQNELFLREFGLDPKHFPPRLKYEQMTGKEELMIRLKIEGDSKKFLHVSNAKLQLAQLLAASQQSHQQNLMALYSHSSPELNVTKPIKAIK